MANAELQKFLEDRLTALDPSLDLSPGSPAQTKFIAPVIDYLGTDPFETDIDKFITDRFAQDFPEIYASDPGALRDVFVKPLQLILEPFKRETQSIRRSQSLIDPTQLSDDDADAIVANVFDTRDAGGFAVGQARLYFPNPSDLRIEVGNMVYSKTNLNFFPTSPVAITAETMVYNREGTLFYLDVPVRAEKAGSEYNVEADEIVGIQGVPNVLRVTNLRKFTGGSVRQDTQAFVAAAENSLTERSLSNRRGTVARLFNVFKGQLRAVQVIGAKDPEMQRDILVATSPGHAWITGQVDIYRGIAYVRAMTVEGSESDVPKAGDTLYFYIDKSQSEFLSTPQESRFVRLQVEEVYLSQRLASSPYQLSYFVRWSDPNGLLSEDMLSTFPRSFQGGFAKKGTVKISSVPDIGTVDASVDNQAVHVYGRSDVYVRPTSQNTTKVVLDGAYDLGKAGSTANHPHFYLERSTLVTSGGSNAVYDCFDNAGNPTFFDFRVAGVEVGDLLSIEEGADAGLYTISDITNEVLDEKWLTKIYLDSALKTGSANAAGVGSLRYRVLKKIRINLFEPRVLRFPFGDAVQRDLRTTIGSGFVTLASNDLLRYGAKIGDTLRILEGPDTGDYIIQAFDTTLGGQGVFLDKNMSATGFNIPIEVFATMNAVERPLVRLSEILLLDSAKQSTGLSVPPADPVAVVPTGSFTSAKVLGQGQLPSCYVLPDLAGITDYLTNQAADSGDRRYSMGFDTPDGTYISVWYPGSQAEFDLRSDTSGKCSFAVLTCEAESDATNFPPIDPKPGDAFSLKSGPNKGDYLIKAVYKFKYTKDFWISEGDGGYNDRRTNWVYFIQIYGTFPVDPLKEIWNFLNDYGVGFWAGDEGGGTANGPGGLENLQFPIQFPNFFTDWYGNLGNAMSAALQAWGMTDPPSGSELQTVIDSMCASYYEWGAPARGVLRTYFREPTVFEQKTGMADVVTTYSLKTSTGQLMKYRPDPIRYRSYEIVPSRLTKDALPTEYLRNLQIDGNPPGDLTNVSFTGEDQPSIFSMGVEIGDFLSVHHEVPLIEGPRTLSIIVQTVAGSTKLMRPAALPDSTFKASMLGNLLFIEEGVDAGGYHVTGVATDGSYITVDRVLSSTSPIIVKQGSASFYYDPAGNGTNIVINDTGEMFASTDVGGYLTVFGVDEEFIGSFRIAELLNANPATGMSSTVAVEAPEGTQFPAVQTNCYWITTDAPDTQPAQVVRGDTPNAPGTDVVAGVLIRMYEAKPIDLEITELAREPSASYCTVGGTVPDLTRQPYRIYRPDIRRITTTEMSEKQDGFLYYLDTEVVSLSPSDLANIPQDSYLVVDEGTYSSLGYRHVVEDPNFSYSMQETGFIDLPTYILPVGSEDMRGNLVRIVGSPIQISYERADLVQQVQEFVDSATDRLLAAGILARHFLPAYISYDAVYSGGSAPSVVAQDISSYIEQTPVETAVDVSELEGKIMEHGGNPDTPTKISATVYDWDRRMWVEFSENYLGGASASDTKVPYNGSPRVTFFLPGTDVSGLDVLPNGERINLKRR